MKRRNISVEEEFFAYGGDEVNSGYARNGRNGQNSKVTSPLAKIIQILLVLVLIAILIVLGIIGYMYAKKALIGEKSATTAPVAVQKKTLNSTYPQQVQSSNIASQSQQNQQKIAANIVQKQPQEVALKKQKSMESSSAMISKSSEEVAVSQTTNVVEHSSVSQVQKALAAKQTTLEETQKIAVQSSSAVVQKENAKLQQSSSVVSQVNSSNQSSLQETQNSPESKNMYDMSDEELIAYLRSLKPDQLKKLDIEKLILARKKAGEEQKEQNVKIAKTEYLNNQVVLDKNIQTKKQKSQIAALSQKLSSLVTTTPQKVTNKKYIQGLEKEAAVRESTNRYYIVVPGDSLSKIAKQFYGKASAYVKIYEANQDIIKDPRLIYPGQKLRIPDIQ